MIRHFRHLSREELNALPCAYPDLGDEVAHFYVCKACGQAIDVRRLGDVLHHEAEDHAPLPVH